MNKDFKPTIYKFYKPPEMTSYDLIRILKRNYLKGQKKIGHFGTLDPFAEGLLLIGVNGASRLNDYIHNLLDKTYMATGILGKETPSGDLTTEISNTDNSEYLRNEISSFSKEFIEEKLIERFLGEYWQEPHPFSASKFQGKKLYEYAREGIEIKKEPKKRYIHEIKVLGYEYPKLKIKFRVSSGTFIRTLFSDCARYLGTLGVLEKLHRSAIGEESIDQHSVEEMILDAHKVGLDHILPFKKVELSDEQILRIKNGNPVDIGLNDDFRVWMIHNSEICGLGAIEMGKIKPIINF